jgi:hypothetical protein
MRRGRRRPILISIDTKEAWRAFHFPHADCESANSSREPSRIRGCEERIGLSVRIYGWPVDFCDEPAGHIPFGVEVGFGGKPFASCVTPALR